MVLPSTTVGLMSNPPIWRVLVGGQMDGRTDSTFTGLPEPSDVLISFIFFSISCNPLEIQGWGGDKWIHGKSRNSPAGDLWEMLMGKENAGAPGSPTVRGGRALGAGSRGRAPHPARGGCRAGPGDQRLRIPHREPQWGRHLPAARQKPSLASKGKKALLMRLLKTQALGAARRGAQARRRGR